MNIFEVNQNRANKYLRAGNFLIDIFCSYGFLLLFNIILDGVGKSSPKIENNYGFLSIIIMGLYFVIFEYFYGKTIGKFITNTKVIMKNGNNPSLFDIVKRTICRFIPFDPISFFWLKGWHDDLSDTIVINNSKKHK